MYAGRQGAAAATDARSFLRTAGWRDRSSPFMVLVAHLGYRQSGAEPRGILDEAAARLNTAVWPYPVVAYMRGEVTADRLMEIAATNDQKTEAHTYVGMDLLLKGRVQDAREHFVWVRDYGNKRFIEYALALAELGRMGRSADETVWVWFPRFRAWLSWPALLWYAGKTIRPPCPHKAAEANHPHRCAESRGSSTWMVRRPTPACSGR